MTAPNVPSDAEIDALMRDATAATVARAMRDMARARDRWFVGLGDADIDDDDLARVVGKLLADLVDDANAGHLTPRDALVVVADLAVALLRRATT